MKANSPTGELCSARWRVVMSAKGDEFCVRDVLDAAWFRGELEAAWTRLLQEAACEALADERALEAEAETLQAMSEEFRYERDLLTAEETEQWLVARDLTEEEFSSWFQRRYWYERLQAAAGNATYPVGPPGGEPFVAPTTKGSPPGNQSYPAASPELWEMLRADLMLSGEFDRLAHGLSWRLVALASASDARTDDNDMLAAERTRFLSRTGLAETALSEALTRLGRGPDWVDSCTRVEAAYRALCEKLLTNEQRARCLAAQRLPLTRVELETFVAPSLPAAKEVVLCLGENQATIEELAAECGTISNRRTMFLGDCPEDVQRAMLCSSPGEVLAPQACDGGFTVSRLARKWEADLQDPEVRERIDRRLLEAHFNGLAAKHVQWFPGREPCLAGSAGVPASVGHVPQKSGQNTGLPRKSVA